MEKEFKKYLDNIENSTVFLCEIIEYYGSVLRIWLDKDDVQYGLWLACTWRIETGSQIIATSSDDITLIAENAKMFEGKQVVSFELSKYNDLFIEFSDNLYIRILNIFSYSNTDNYNWNFWVPSEDLDFEITNNFEIKKGKFDSNS
jgi:hypothetical protein